MKREKEAMAQLFAVAVGRRSDARFSIYRHLVYVRHEAVLAAVFARSKAALDQKEWQKWVTRFIARSGGDGPLEALPGQFWHFLRAKGAIKRRAWLIELLWLEWQHNRLLRQAVRPKSLQISSDRRYRLSGWAAVRWMRFRPFDAGCVPMQRALEPVGLLLFLDPDTLQVRRLEMTRFMTDFLKHLKRPRSIKKALKKTAKKHQISPQKVEAVVPPALALFGQKGVLVEQGGL
jgi:hypothetical protein